MMEILNVIFQGKSSTSYVSQNDQYFLLSNL